MHDFPKDAASFLEPPPPALHNPGLDHLAEFFQFCCAVNAMEPTDSIDCVRRLFLLVTEGDLAFNILGPDCSNMKKQGVKAIVTNVLGDGDCGALREMLTLAAQLTFVCRNLGMGALFWLHSQLSDSL